METPLTGIIKPDRAPMSIQEYEDAGGYQALRKALDMKPQAIQQMVSDSNLRGRGGAGFPTGKKWGFVPMGDDCRRPKYFLLNADEMEPGTMKDRWLLEGNPHLVVEGLIIASLAIEADFAYIFLRWAYHLAAQRLIAAMGEAYERGYLGGNILGSGRGLQMSLHTSAGRYMCGEEDGLINAMEGERAIPSSKPPYPQTVGLWGKPTVVNNVETVACVPYIVEHGADAFKSLSRTDNGGTKLYGASGHVNRPGLWELPLGTTVGEILNNHAGGMAAGYELRALLPGGGSTGFLTPDHLDGVMDFDALEPLGSRIGTGTMIVLDQHTCVVDVIYGLMLFFARESCGYCTPCREGLPWAARTLQAIEEGEGRPEDLDVLQHHVEQIKMHWTFCAHAPGAMAPLETGLKHFREDFERHIDEQRCPWKT